MKTFRKKYIVYLFSLLFTWYYGSVMLFTHIHIKDGVAIKHSHPFKNIEHHHKTLSEIIFLQTLSTINAEDSQNGSPDIQCFLNLLTRIVEKNDSHPYLFFLTSNNLRAPPYTL